MCNVQLVKYSIDKLFIAHGDTKNKYIALAAHMT